MKLPKSILHYFWGDDHKKLSWPDNQDYIAQTILDKGDLQASSWLLKKTDKQYLRSLLNSRQLHPKSRNFWQIYLS